MRSRAVRRVSYRGWGSGPDREIQWDDPATRGNRAAVSFRFGTCRRLMYVFIVSRCRFVPVRYVSVRVRPPPPPPSPHAGRQKMLAVITCRTHTYIILCNGVSGHLFRTVGPFLRMYCESTNFPRYAP